MRIHYHYKEQPVTIHIGQKASSAGFGFRVVTQCERCGCASDQYYLYADVYLCDNCYTELLQAVNHAYDKAGPLYE